MTNTIRTRVKVAVVALVVMAAACSNLGDRLTTTGSISFIALGDMPYGAKAADGRTDDEILHAILVNIAAAGRWPFAVHYGDIGRSPAVCNDAALMRTRDAWRDELRIPVFYTPGDNEWEDCDRDDVQPPVSELERLDAIRRFLVPSPIATPESWQAVAQDGMPENQRWSYRGVVFSTFHLVGKGNGREDVRKDDPALGVELAEQRDRRNAEWITAAFQLAKSSGAPAVVLVTQTDLFRPRMVKGVPADDRPTSERCAENTVNAKYCAQIASLAAEFGKPVLLIHGDTSAYCLDQPFGRGAPATLWRLNGPGDYQLLDAAVVTIDPAATTPFRVTEFTTGKSLPAECDYRR